MTKVYEKPGIFAFAEYEDAVEAASYEVGDGTWWIFECINEDDFHGYNVVCNFSFDSACDQGWIPLCKVTVETIVQVNHMFTGAIPNKEKA